MPHKTQLTNSLKNYQQEFQSVVPFDPVKDKLLLLDFTDKNKELTDEILSDTNKFSDYITNKLHSSGSKYGIGGYAEHRTIYNRSKHFDSPTGEEPRRLHLGIDIWGAVSTPVIAPVSGIVHSFAFNNNFGDYGATIILSHVIDGISFHTLYGHLSFNSLKNISEGDFIDKGDIFSEFGMQFENGHWPAHLHFQVIIDMKDNKGDYIGVCPYSEKNKYLRNTIDPDLILGMMKFVP